MERERAFEARDRVLFDGAPDGIFVGQLCPEGPRCVDANPAACAMLGYSREELVGMKVDDLFPPGEVAPVVQDVEAMRAGGGHVMRESRLRRKDGAVLPVEAIARMLDDSRWLAFVRDISARKEVEREREESLAWLSTVLDQSPVGIVLLCGPTGDRVEHNRCAEEMFGGPPDPELGWVGHIFAPDGRPLARDELPARRALFDRQVVAAVEVLGRRADGSTKPLLGSAAPLLDRDGALLGAIGVFQDITARSELDRLRAEWGSVVAHDLRQPLASISLTAGLITRIASDPAVARGAERILTAGNRLGRMVGDLMDLSRLDAHRLELLRQPLDVPALVRATVERMALAAEDRRFDVRMLGDAPPAFADPDRITQILENLLTNAVKYGRPGTPIAVTVAGEGGAVAVAVTNAGDPLSEEDAAHLFERFQRTDAAKAARIPGVGLGLYITRSLVEAHGGQIRVESAAGTNTFRFTLPVAALPAG